MPPGAHNVFDLHHFGIQWHFYCCYAGQIRSQAMAVIDSEVLAIVRLLEATWRAVSMDFSQLNIG